MEDISKLRDEIDDIDNKLTKLFEERMNIVKRVAEYKKNNNVPVLNSNREEEVINKNIKNLKDKTLNQYAREYLDSMMTISKNYQKNYLNSLSVKDNSIETDESIKNISKDSILGFPGVPGAFSEEALYSFFGDGITAYNVEEFEDIFIEIVKGTIKYGIVPIENSSTGSIADVYDYLNKYESYIAGEICLKINQNLIGIKGASIEDITEVYSHPQGFGQSKHFLKKHSNWKLIPMSNTSKGSEYVKEQNSKNIAAIGSLRASQIYDLEIIKSNINSNDLNTTRFAVISKELVLNKDNDKISIVLSTEHKAGSLCNVLKHFAENSLNLLKIESRPIKEKPWEYYFYIDFEGNLLDEKVKDVISSLKECCSYIKILGNYKKYSE
ncbi:MAG: prephenate dehydratase [Bacillota bacterium]|nr:prephenate dehydratase [Bacillota bacterium]